MADTYRSLNQQIAETEENLRLIAERKAEYTEQQLIPLDLIKNERRLQEQLADLEAQCVRLQEIPCPYRGLEYFDVRHAADYFGREVMVQKLVARLQETNFVVVVGPSGSGKSSLVRAGLVSALRNGALLGSAGWGIDILRPGEDPLRALAAPLADRLAPGLSPVDRLAETRKLADHLTARSLPMADILAQLRKTQSTLPRLLLIIDQFEEAFTLCSDEKLRQTFFEALFAAIEAPWLTVILTLRADFYGRVLADEQLSQCVDQGLVNVMPMTVEERRAAIEQPALRTGGRFEEGLVQRILDAIADAPGDLPLLEFALTELSAQQTADGLLTHAAYEAIGEVKGAIANRADDTLSGLNPEQRRTVQGIFTRLVQVARPDEAAADTRRRIELAELAPETQDLVRRLTDARLLVTGRDAASGEETIEVAHEALIRGWGQLQEWLNRDREFLLWRQQLRTLAGIWEESGRNEGALLRDALLREARVRAVGRATDLSALELAYIRESELAAEHAAQEQEAARQRELVQARELAAEQERRAEAERQRAEGKTQATRQLYRRNLALGMALILSLVALGVAVRFLVSTRETSARVEYQSRRTKADDLAAAARLELSKSIYDPSLALLLAEEAISTTWETDGYVTISADVALREAVATVEPLGWYMNLFVNGTNYSASFSPDSRWILSVDDSEKAVHIWNAETGAELRQLHGHSGLVYSAAFGPDGRHIVTAGEDGTARLWDAETGVELRQFLGHNGSVHSAAFSPDGRHIVTAGEDGTIRLWDAETGVELRQFLGHNGSVHSAAFSPDGRHIVTASEDGTVHLLDAETGVELRQLHGHSGRVYSAAFSPDGRHIVTAGEDGTARLWDAETGVELRQFLGHNGSVHSAAFSPDGRHIVTAGEDRTIRIWDAETGSGVRQLLGHEPAIRSAAYSPDGRHLVSAGEEWGVRIWDTEPRTDVQQLRGHSGSVLYAAFSPDGQHIVTAGEDGTARLWDAETGVELRQFLGHSGRVYFAFLSPNGRHVFTGGEDGTARLWDAETGAELRQLPGFSIGWFNFDSNADGQHDLFDFSADGQRYLTVGKDGMVRIWDAETGAELRQLRGHSGLVYFAAFSPDGQHVLTGGEDGTARLWDAETGAELRQLGGHSVLEEWRFVLSFDGHHVLTVGADGTPARIWDAETGAELQLVGFDGAFWFFRYSFNGSAMFPRFSPDGRYVVNLSQDMEVDIWDAETGGEPRRLRPNLGCMDWDEEKNYLKFSPDGRRILTLCDRAFRIWDVETGVQLRQVDLTNLITSAEYSPDGQHILTVNEDGTIRLWVAEIEDLLARAHSLIQRDPPTFYYQERSQFVDPSNLRRKGFGPIPVSKAGLSENVSLVADTPSEVNIWILVSEGDDVKVSDFTAWVDLSELSPGEHDVPVRVSAGGIDQPNVVAIEPNVIRVRLEERVR